MVNIRKILTLTSLISMAGVILMLITAIFKVKVFEMPLLALLFTLITISVAAAFAISAYSLLKKNKVVPIISLALLGIVSIMGIITYWTNFSVPEAFGKITAILAIATVLFNIMVSYAIKLGRRQLPIQIITYGLIIITDIILTLLILGVNVFSVPGMPQIFAVICLLDLGFMLALVILNKRTYNEGEDAGDVEYIKVKKTEYMALVERVKELEAQLGEK